MSMKMQLGVAGTASFGVISSDSHASLSSAQFWLPSWADR